MIALFAGLRIYLQLRGCTDTRSGREGGEKTESDSAAHSNSKCDNRSLGVQLTEGFRIIGRNRFLLGATLLISAGNIGLALGDSMVSVAILRVLDLGVPFYGALGTHAAIAGTVGASLAPRVIRTIPIRTVFIISSILQALIACIPLLAWGFPGASRVLFIIKAVGWSFTLTVANIAGFSYIAKVVDKTQLWRASAAMRMINMGPVFAALLGGVLANLGSIYVPLAIWQVLTAVAVAVYIPLTRVYSTDPGPREGSHRAI